MTISGTCESCGVEDDHLSAVHRKYLATTDGIPERVLDEVERWCVACRTSYPHEPAE